MIFSLLAEVIGRVGGTNRCRYSISSIDVTMIPTKVCLHHYCLCNPTCRKLVVVHSKYSESIDIKK